MDFNKFLRRRKSMSDSGEAKRKLDCGEEGCDANERDVDQKIKSGVPPTGLELEVVSIPQNGFSQGKCRRGEIVLYGPTFYAEIKEYPWAQNIDKEEPEKMKWDLVHLLHVIGYGKYKKAKCVSVHPARGRNVLHQLELVNLSDDGWSEQ